MSTVTVEGTLEAVGKTVFGDSGVEIRTADKKLLSVPLSHDQVRQLAPSMFGQVRVTISSVAA
jgi:hypothetical protein